MYVYIAFLSIKVINSVGGTKTVMSNVLSGTRINLINNEVNVVDQKMQ